MTDGKILITHAYMHTACHACIWTSIQNQYRSKIQQMPYLVYIDALASTIFVHQHKPSMPFMVAWLPIGLKLWASIICMEGGNVFHVYVHSILSYMSYLQVYHRYTNQLMFVFSCLFCSVCLKIITSTLRPLCTRMIEPLNYCFHATYLLSCMVVSFIILGCLQPMEVVKC